MNIADDLVRAFNDGYEKGKADAEAYMLHCGDTDEPQTNADRIRSMSDEKLAEWVWGAETAGRAYGPRGKKAWLDWLKQEVSEDFPIEYYENGGK